MTDWDVLVAEANTNSFGWALLLHSRRLTAILIKAMAVEWKFISVGDEDARGGEYKARAGKKA